MSDSVCKGSMESVITLAATWGIRIRLRGTRRSRNNKKPMSKAVVIQTGLIVKIADSLLDTTRDRTSLTSTIHVAVRRTCVVMTTRGCQHTDKRDSEGKRRRMTREGMQVKGTMHDRRNSDIIHTGL